MKSIVRSLVAGALLGGSLSFIGFSSWDEVHAMFAFTDFRLMMTFAMAVALLVPLWFALERTRLPMPSARPFHKGIVPGSILFGIGWAISGACPGISFVQLGEGQFGALATLAGIFAGNALFGALNPRLFHVPATSCVES